jgi:hypothetical protein
LRIEGAPSARSDAPPGTDGCLDHVDPVTLVMYRALVELLEVQLEEELAFLRDGGGISFKEGVDFT